MNQNPYQPGPTGPIILQAQEPVKSSGTVFGALSLVFGIIGVLFCWSGCVVSACTIGLSSGTDSGTLGLIVGGVLLLLCLTGIIFAGVGLAKSPRGRRGLAVAGLVLSIIGLVFCLFGLLFSGLFSVVPWESTGAFSSTYGSSL